MNKIRETQLEELQLKHLAAQRWLYSKSKVIQTWQMIVNVLAVPILSVLPAIFSDFATWVPFLSIVLVSFNILVLTPRQKSSLEKAAKIQESFDCHVLELNWRDLSIGSPVEMETIEFYALKYERNDSRYSKLKDWYSTEISELPIHWARFVCQRANLWWDSKLRQRYAKLIGVVLVFLVGCALGWGLRDGLTFKEFILVVAPPLAPVFFWGIQQSAENKESAANLNSLRTCVEGLWDKALKDGDSDELTGAARELQDAIYNHRRTSPLIPDWLYNLLQKEDENLMNKAAENLVKEARDALRDPKGEDEN